MECRNGRRQGEQEMGGWSLPEQGGREDRREAEMEKKVTMDGERENELGILPQ